MRVTLVNNIEIVCMLAGQRPLRDGPPVLGCAIIYPNGVCDVAVRKDLPSTTQKQVIRHERGHCNGWVHD